MANMQVTVVDGNNVTVSLDRGVAGVGIASISLVVINQANYLLITYTNGTTQTVGPVGVIQYNATTPINISGSTISLLTVPVNLGGTGQTTAAAGLNALLPAQTSQANKYLQTDGTNASWDAISLSTADITGILPVVNGGTGVSTSTGTGNTVLSTSPTLVTPVLGTPASGTLTNATGLPVATGISGLGTGIATFLATPSSANLAAALTDETGTGAAVFATSPTLVTPALGTPASGVMTNVTGTAAGLTAGNVTTNANLTGDITSIGNATTLTNAPVIAKVLTGYISGAGTVAATDSILQAIQKLDGNNSTNANLTGPITSVGNVTSIASQTGTGTKFVVDTSPTLITPDLGTPTALVGTNITGTALSFTSSNVTTNANLTGDVTSVGNATAIAAGVIVNADINASAAIDDTKLATIATALKVSNSATTAASANTASAIVARDASGDFTAGTVTAALTGNASTATALATGRTIAITGDLAYTSPSFDGTGNVTAAGTLATVATAGATGSSTAIPVITINAKGLTTSITTAVVVAPAGTLTGSTLASGVTASSLTSLGTIANLSVTAGTISTTPSASTDIANKDYVDTVAQGLDPKASCVAATTANITLSGTQTIDGVALIAADRCLVKDQTAPADNGIYIVASGAWARSADMNAWVEVPGAFTFIEQGTQYADTGWVCTSNAGGTLGTTAITFVQFAGAGSYTASTGLTLTGTAFSLTAPVTVALGGTNATSAGIASFNNITGYTAAGATGTTSTNLVFSTSPTLVTPDLGTPSALVLTSATGLPLTTGVTGTLPVANGGTGITSFGTGVATALGVNTGSAGAFVVNGGALGSPNTVGTMPAFTLGGTVSGGGNQINNVEIGASSALAGSFTTLSATGTSTLAAINASGNVTSTGTVGIANNSGYLMKDSAGNYRTMSILNGSNIMSFGDTDNFGAAEVRLIAGTGNPLKLYGGNTLVATLTSTGLAVTGTLSTTGNVTIAPASGAARLDLNGGGGSAIYLDDTSANGQWLLGANNYAAQFEVYNVDRGSLDFKINNATGLATFANSLAVTGTLSATGTLSGGTSGTGYSFSGSAPATSLTLSSSGNLGIGTSSPNLLSWNNAVTLNTASGNSAYEVAIGGVAQAYFAADATNVYLAVYANKPLLVRTNNATVATFDTSGNLGLGVTPSAWSLYKAFQNGATSVADYASGNNSVFGSGLFYGGSPTDFRYVSTGQRATSYRQVDGSHTWNTTGTVTGTAGGVASLTQAMTLDASGRLQIASTNNTAANAKLVVGTGLTSTNGIVVINTADTNIAALVLSNWDGATTSYGPRVVFDNSGIGGFTIGASDGADNFDICQTWGTPRVRIDSSGNLLVGTTSSAGTLTSTTTDDGFGVDPSGYLALARSGGSLLYCNRLTDDGFLVEFIQAGTKEGDISVSGTTVSYNGGHLSRYAQTTASKDDTLVKGTVMSNLDEMNVYTKDGQPVDNEQLNKVKVSDVEGDANVAGVFVNWTHDEAHDVDEINMAMTGDMIIRIAQGVTVARGDLLMSAGDGTAKPQGDDIVRSKTVAKVTSTHVTCTYADGSFCVPCVLMAC